MFDRVIRTHLSVEGSDASGIDDDAALAVGVRRVPADHSCSEADHVERSY